MISSSWKSLAHSGEAVFLVKPSGLALRVWSWKPLFCVIVILDVGWIAHPSWGISLQSFLVLFTSVISQSSVPWSPSTVNRYFPFASVTPSKLYVMLPVSSPLHCNFTVAPARLVFISVHATCLTKWLNETYKKFDHNNNNNNLP